MAASSYSKRLKCFFLQLLVGCQHFLTMLGTQHSQEILVREMGGEAERVCYFCCLDVAQNFDFLLPFFHRGTISPAPQPRVTSAGWSYCRRIGDKTPGWLPADRITELAQLIAGGDISCGLWVEEIFGDQHEPSIKPVTGP